ncbi:Prolyl oligopeptidase [Gracilaria domingensis]|nr:Prolyl oligopeptidase [Gracilaria domingensis]
MNSVFYPVSRRDESVIDDLHGHEVSDPYRWLENPDSPETIAWIEEQNEVTSSFLIGAESSRPKIQAVIEGLMNYDRFSCPWKRGSYFYYHHRAGLANQAVLMQAEGIDSEPRVFLDPNTMSEDGTVTIGSMSWSNDGEYLAYGLKRGGSDWEEIHVMDCQTLDHLSEALEWAKFTSIAWTHDGKGFYYARFPPPASLEGIDDKERRGAETDESRFQALYYHSIGTSQDQDRLVFSDDEHPTRLYGVSITFDGQYLLVTSHDDCSPKNQVWVVNLTNSLGNEAGGMRKVIDQSYNAQFLYIGNNEDVFFFNTNWKAPKNRIIQMKIDETLEHCTELIAEHSNKVLSEAMVVNYDQLVLKYMEDAYDKLSIHNLKSGGHLFDVPLPDIGSVSISGRRDQDFMTYMFTSFLYAGIVFYVDLTIPVKDGTRVFRRMDPPGFDPSKYKTRQIFYTSKDGTKIPMFVIGTRSSLESGSSSDRPCLLYGYGGFMISLTPAYSARWAAWLEALGGSVAIANLRGGDEYGSEWHEQGILEKKQNVFDDFQWAAKYLCNEMKITTPKRLMIMGGSNGGLLVGACVNQAPELYGAAVAQVGVHDILRFHKFTIGSAWVSDFGDPDNPEHFEFQKKYSPLHNVFSPDERGVPYPAILLTTGDHDDRVVPLHTLKYGATLQYKAGRSKLQEGKPLLIRVDVKAGHGAGKPTTKVIQELCDTLLFAALSLDIHVAQK